MTTRTVPYLPSAVESLQILTPLDSRERNSLLSGTDTIHSHIHTVAPEGVFTESGYLVHIPYVCQLRAVEIWKEKVFDLLLEEGRIDLEVVAMINSWRHTGFSVDNSVRIEAGDEAGMQRYLTVPVFTCTNGQSCR